MDKDKVLWSMSAAEHILVYAFSLFLRFCYETAVSCSIHRRPLLYVSYQHLHVQRASVAQVACCMLSAASLVLSEQATSVNSDPEYLDVCVQRALSEKL